MSKYCIQVSWDDVPHLSEESKAELREQIPIHQLEARERGIPVLGSGVIYPVPESAFVCDPIEIPAWWPKAYAMDVGWKRTAALWGAWDRESDTVYLYSEHYRGQAEPSIHADAIKARGDWIPGVIDPASAGASQIDGKKLLNEYEKLGLILSPAENAVEAGIHAVYRRLSTGRLKVFKSLLNFLAEIRIYRRDDKGKVVKENDHLMDCCKYLILSGMKHAVADMTHDDYQKEQTGGLARERSSVTGY
jgi:hypothetical protein